jgi:hypothetical protein
MSTPVWWLGFEFMSNRLLTQHLSAELSTLDRLLSTLSQEDVLGRIGLESRRHEVATELSQLEENPEQLASVALLFGGQPVKGSIGIESTFAADAVYTFQQLITNIWASEEGTVGRRGPVERQDESQLHITSLLHGSIGFLLEEVDSQNRLMPSALKQASDRATEIVAAFTADDEEPFRRVLESVDSRVLGSTREFLTRLYRGGATLELVEGEIDLQLTFPAVQRGYERAENANIEESEDAVTGQLLGLIPIGRRFEIRVDDGSIISGSVAPTLSESYLEHLKEQQLVGQRCRAVVRNKRITRFGRVSNSFVLMDLAPFKEGGQQ